MLTTSWREFIGARLVSVLAFFTLFLIPAALFAQMDQGYIGGIVQDSTGAVIPNAVVTLTDTGTNTSLDTKSNASGVYTFPAQKVGNYKVAATAPGFRTTTQENIHLDVQAHLDIVMVLELGAASQTVTVSADQAQIQNQDASVGQVMSTETIDRTPLNGRNWVYIAHMATGVNPSNGSRGAGKGDFYANGQHAEQNNFILNGIDNNSYAVDYMNGSSYNIQPPPDALSEFKLQTANSSVEFGHSAGAVVNAAIRSGTNNVHGRLWEYVRNDFFDAADWNSIGISKYRQNQFGATLGAPILRNKLFFFGYSEADRVIFGNPSKALSVPTDKMRNGDFTELLDSSLTANKVPVKLFMPGSAGTVPLACGSQVYVICSGSIDPIAQKILQMYPEPNVGLTDGNGHQVYQNYITNSVDENNVWQWGTRIDWTPRPSDQLFLSYSYSNDRSRFPPPLGPIIDGGGYGTDGDTINLSSLAAFSWTHIFSPTLVNEVRVGYNYGRYTFLQVGNNYDVSSSVGLGGIPYNDIGKGGLPVGSVSGIAAFGPTAYMPNKKGANANTFMDNLSKTWGDHSLRFGFSFDRPRIGFLSPQNARGGYTFNGLFTSDGKNSANTGSGVADFLLDQMATSTVGSAQNFGLNRVNVAGYAEDNWRATRKLTVTYGLRLDVFRPLQPNDGMLSAVRPNSPELAATYSSTGAITAYGSTGVMLYTRQAQNVPLSPTFTKPINKDGITIGYSSDKYLSKIERANLAPRFGVAYSFNDRTVIRAGYGLFYGGMTNPASYKNYPWQFMSTFPRPGACTPGNCQTNGITLETGFATQIAAGLINSVSSPTFAYSAPVTHTQYAENWNLTVERVLTPSMSFTAGYVASVGKHLDVQLDDNGPVGLIDPKRPAKQAQPFPDLGAMNVHRFIGVSNYNSLQTKLDKRFSRGLNFLVSYTWSHSLDDARPILGTTGDGAYRAPNIVGIGPDYSNSGNDARHRIVFNAYYELPFGQGQRWANRGGVANTLIGGWSSSLTFTAQTGFPFSVSANQASPVGGTAFALKIADPFKSGGTPQVSGVDCSVKTRTTAHWYNPCAWGNPLVPAFTNTSASGVDYTTMYTGGSALPYLGGVRNQIASPGFNRTNLSMFKKFTTFREQSMEFRADAFNVFNTPAYAMPSIDNNAANGGQITSTRNFQNNTPDARFFQLSLKYVY